MCGIAGIISKIPLEDMVPLLKNMSDSLTHRGPDGEGQWQNDTQTIGLAHRRLSILDISDQGTQPMHYQNRYTITYNGEVYNYVELRADLEKKGHHFQSNTDTEVLLALYAEYGENCLQKLEGMFAFAIYDRQQQKVFCARDRFGEKPFYYYHSGDSIVFASEMKALWAMGTPKEENPTMHYNYLAYGFLKNPQRLSDTFYKNIHSLPHAHYLLYDLRSDNLDVKQYYQVNSQELGGSDKQVDIQLENLLEYSVTNCLRSDVAVGCSLSGGLDSSLIATLVKKKIGDHELKTFSAVFPGFAKDESAFIKQTVEKTSATSYTVTPSLEEFKAEKTAFLTIQEEPVVDDSPYILYKVYELAQKNGIKVLLDGQGADEVFAGYHAYYFTFLKEMRSKNSALYKEELKAFRKLVQAGVVNDYRFFRRQNLLALLLGERLSDIRIWKQKIDQFRSAKIDQDLYQLEHKNSFKRAYNFDTLSAHLNHDAWSGKLQTLLRYADRSAMAHGVEIRLPYLNHKLVDFVFSLPSEVKIKSGWTKWILRDTFQDIMAQEVVWRRDKVGAEGELK